MMTHCGWEVKMDLSDLNAIETVFANLDLEDKLAINITEIIHSLERKGCINKMDKCAYMRYFAVKPDVSPAVKIINFNAFLWQIVAILSFTQLISVFEDAGYIAVCHFLCAKRGIPFCCRKEIENERTCVFYQTRTEENISLDTLHRLLSSFIPKSVPKRILPHADNIRRYYIKLKVLADNNGFPLGTRVELNNRIAELDHMISECKSSCKRQYFIDKRAIVYLLLTQQYADCCERNRVLKRLHDSMPQGNDVDRTIFDAIFHSFMAINWASKGNDHTADRHIQLARQASDTCLSSLPAVVANTGAHLMQSEMCLRHCSADALSQGEHDYAYALQLTNDLTDEERSVWVNVIMVRRASSLLGIDLFCNINEIQPDCRTVNQARNILTKLRQCKLPLQKRHEMVVYLCIGRLHDIEGDKLNAVKYVQKALSLVQDGTFDSVEKANIKSYLSRLTHK
ncbi:uncharacterized protein LOC123555075 [Mercenaria mercenaria]|uniref:uncharacterized protein LOC123555075 n=1 Tax=Mercenaria mercenaria TaxID=6596 RepID=UPI00234EFDA0|nr:uncharacterized protein LOC123555075 [Mercenaria mercenaria]XP_045201565.2 uncharacterized protein LOC123555075 [Mercenaria mercenaria]XP_053403398.1 uncharacterized protein LOC123555075 [Mercenaria mercenaria]XP_053403399.1 uncharacterized protein LOC123555075 [Mercenaria mercenaria]XP_053403400.1 uncharacterized protein LOC123555075 [Mercenaria mercenaria]